MEKIPDGAKRFTQTNKSDLSVPISRYIKGNIFYTENMNFDEKGYAKLSPRAISLTNSLDDGDFNITTAIGRKGDSYYVATVEKPYEGTISETAISMVRDIDNGGSANAPDLGFDSHGTWWQNLWHVTTETGLFSKDTATGYWTDHSISLTTGLTHNIEVFRNSANRTLCIGNGNAIVQIDTSYSTSGIAQLTIPVNYEITSLSYNSGLMGIAVKASDSAAGQNGEAFFYTWDGVASSANGAYGVGSDMIVSLKAYQSSWVILTRKGELLQFNGGGFTLLEQLPVKSLDLSWGDSTNREAYGDIMQVDGERIYFHLNNRVNYYGENGQVYVPQAPGGVLCYDPAVGIYHRYSPSISKSNIVIVTSSNIDVTTNILTTASGTLYTTGTPIKYVFDGSTPIGGLQINRVYYIIRHNSTTFSLALTPDDATSGTKVDITGTGASNNYFLAVNLVDYGATRMERTGGIGLTAQKNNVLGELTFGGEYIEGASGSNYEYFNFISEGFANRGCLVTTRLQSDNIEDIIEKVIVKYRPLDTLDKIIVKQKTKVILGIPVATPQYGTHCMWTATNTFTTTANLSAIYTYLSADNECEAKIISGNGAGSASQITSVTYNAGTYTVVLEEDIDGVVVGQYCDIVIDNWQKLGEATVSDTEGYMEFPSAKNSPSASFKIELRGSNVTIEEIQIVNSTYTPSA